MTYSISFYYNTDLRDEVVVKASNVISALAIAIERKPELRDWVENYEAANCRYPFKIKIGIA